jgi:hypothetical protein
MPELKEFQATRDKKNPLCNFYGPGCGIQEGKNQAPEYLIKQSPEGIIYPRLGRAGIKFCQKTDRHNYNYT